MTVSMLFRGVSNPVAGGGGVYPQFVDPWPLNYVEANAMNNVGKQATIVFFGSAIFTVVFVVATLVARHHEN